MSFQEPIEEPAEFAAEPRDEKYRRSIITVPNVICFLRLIGSFVMLAFAVNQQPVWFAVLFLILTLSDWIDGHLARWMHQRSDFGARLDSVADAILYASLLLGCSILSWATVWRERWWLAAAVASYALTSGVGLWKFGRFPSYHTYAAKKSQGIVLLAGICLVLDWTVWPLRLAALAVTLTNLEATAMTIVLDHWRADISSLRAALRLKQPAAKENAESV